MFGLLACSKAATALLARVKVALSSCFASLFHSSALTCKAASGTELLHGACASLALLKTVLAQPSL